MKTEIRDVSGTRRDVRHFTAEAPGAYGWAWSEAVKEYLKNAYKEEGKEADIVAVGINYKVLDRGEVTAFYDKDGRNLFDVENKRLEREYEWFMNNDAGTAPGHEEVGEDNGDTEKDITVGPEEADTEAGQASEEGQREDEKEAAPPDGAGNSMNPSGKEGGQDSALEKAGCPEETDGQSAMQAAKKKLGEELEGAKDKDFADPIIAYLLKHCEEDEGLAQDVMQGHKTWEKCLGYIFSQARKQSNGNRAAVRDEVVYEWAEDYYHLDDKAEAEGKNIKAEEAKAKKEAAPQRKAPATKGKAAQAAAQKKTSIKKKPAKATEAPPPVPGKKQEKPKEPQKKNGREMEGQLDMFSMLGLQEVEG